MRATKTLAIAFAAAFALTGAARAATTVTIQYPYGELFNETHKQIVAAFEKTNPDIKVKLRAPYESYEDGTQKVLREAITGQTPDITFQGLNRLRILVDRGIAVGLGKYIKAEKDFEAEGFHQAMFDIGTMKGDVFGVPFAISLPVAYYNLDLVKKAGAIAQAAGLTDDKGFCPIDAATMRSAKDPNVYVLGDASIAGDMPKSGFSANSQAKVAAMNVRGDLTGSRVFPARYSNTCWSLIETDDGVKVGASYEPKDGKIASIQGFISKTGEDAALRKATYEESVGWYAGISADIFG